MNRPSPVNWYGMMRMTYASSEYIGAAIAMSQPGAELPGNRSFTTIDARTSPGISEMALGASCSIAIIENANGMRTWSFMRLPSANAPPIPMSRMAWTLAVTPARVCGRSSRIERSG